MGSGRAQEQLALLVAADREGNRPAWYGAIQVIA
jgi:hypothetical protein